MFSTKLTLILFLLYFVVFRNFEVRLHRDMDADDMRKQLVDDKTRLMAKIDEMYEKNKKENEKKEKSEKQKRSFGTI